eukprot:1184908-Prorocentrum_minimum.AAC.3
MHSSKEPRAQTRAKERVSRKIDSAGSVRVPLLGACLGLNRRATRSASTRARPVFSAACAGYYRQRGLWGVECTLAVIGTGGPVKPSHKSLITLLRLFWGVECILAVIGTGGPVK